MAGRPETVRAMSENQMMGGLNVRLLKTAIPPYSNDAEFFPGMVKKWGLGFMINTEQVPGGRSAGASPGPVSAIPISGSIRQSAWPQ